MNAKKKENAAIVGVGVAACAVCCAGPILGVLAAIGLGTAAGFALFGTVAVVVGAVSIAFVLVVDGSAPPPAQCPRGLSRCRSGSPTCAQGCEGWLPKTRRRDRRATQNMYHPCTNTTVNSGTHRGTAVNTKCALTR